MTREWVPRAAVVGQGDDSGGLLDAPGQLRDQASVAQTTSLTRVGMRPLVRCPTIIALVSKAVSER